MKIEIYEGKTKEERTLRLTLRRDEDGDITLSAVDKDGKVFAGSDILWIDAKGIHTFMNVSPDLGLPLTSHNKVVVNP